MDVYIYTSDSDLPDMAKRIATELEACEWFVGSVNIIDRETENITQTWEYGGEGDDDDETESAGE